MPQVTAINIYPIKSCGGISRSSAEVTARGLDGDRRYMLVDADGGFLTQRRHPVLALVSLADADDGAYEVMAPGRPALRLPREWPDGQTVRVKVWQDQVDAAAVPDELGGWFADYLGFACRLVYMAEHQHRAVPNDAAAFDDEVGFADAAPLLLTTEASLADLNSKLRTPVTMTRFRPNLVIDADSAFVEDSWRYIKVGQAELEVAWPSTRCVLTTVDPATGIKDGGGEPLKTLRSYRRSSAGVMFGQNLLPRRCGRVRVGDAVEAR
jgi:uncharacterized protein